MTSGETAAMPGRIKSLDGLRGVASFIVLVHHALLLIPALAAPHYSSKPIENAGSWEWWLTHTPLHLFWDGSSQVFIFFVLSGVVLALLVLRAQKFAWNAYYPQRLVRLYVPVWCSVAVAVATIVAVPRVGDLSNEWLRHHLDLSWKAVLQDVTLIRGAGQVASPLWSLQWEVIFSLALPLYMFVALKWPQLNLFKVAACVGLTSLGAALDSRAMTYLPMFMVGVIMASDWRRIQYLAGQINSLRWGNMAWSLILFIAVPLLVCDWLLMPYVANEVILSAAKGFVLVGATLTVFVAWQWGPVRRFLVRGPLQWLGTVSFSLYLVHEPIVIATAYLMGPDAIGAAIPASVIMSLFAATIFFRLVERPGHSVAKMIHKRLSPEVTARPELSLDSR